MLDGLQAIQARIAQIQSLGGGTGVVRAPVTAAAPTPVSFADALSNATAETGALTPAVKGAPGSYGPVQVPAELRRYGNGKIPESALQSIGVGDYRLSSKAATAFRRMHADASAAGITLGVNDAYRTYDEQVDLARRKGLYSQGGLAATPGKSNHGWGVAVDLELDSRAQAWMRENGYKYGFVEDVAREPWHWTYRPAA